MRYNHSRRHAFGLTEKLAALALAAAFGGALIVMLAGNAAAQEAIPVAAAPKAKVEAVVSDIVDTQQNITVELKKGKLIRLPYPATSIMMADPSIADIDVQSPNTLYLFGRKVGQTTLFATDGEEHKAFGATITVEHNLSGLRNAVKALMPKANVTFRSIDGALTIEGTVPSPGDAANLENLASSYIDSRSEKLINMATVSSADQVMLRVRIAEVARSELKQFGIHLDSILTSGSFVFGLATGRSFLTAGGQFLGSGVTDSLYGGMSRGNWDINGIVDALEDEGMMTILAEPNLTAISGQPANFLAGGEFPIPVVEDEGQVTIEYKQFGVSLAFTPVVISKDRIGLTVAPEVSTLSQLGAVTANGFDIPSLATRRASTTVELGSGQSFAIAGLLQNDTTNDISKFPGLGDLPVLGALFRSNSFRRNETELVILVTPYIVRGVSDSEIATPLDGFTPASDVERILYGKLYGQAKAPGGKPQALAVFEGERPKLFGPAGFVLE